MIILRDKKKLLICVVIPLAVGIAAGLLTRGSMKEFETLNQPPLSPPGWLFPVAWTALYVLMGVASWMVAVSEQPQAMVGLALKLYAIQLAFNFLWPIFFFNMGKYLFSFAWLVILWLLILLTALQFGKISRKSAYLLVPYLAWVAFAGYLNFGIYLLN